jgi:membrane protein involved in colicin uptake
VDNFGDDFVNFPYDREDVQEARQTLLETILSRHPNPREKERENELSPDAEIIKSLQAQILKMNEDRLTKEELAKELNRIRDDHDRAMKEAAESCRRAAEEYRARQQVHIHYEREMGGGGCVIC